MTDILRQLSQGLRWVVDSASRLSVRADTAPIDKVDRVFEFVSTRSALITQKKLYGYLKERMGIRYPTMFEDETFAESISLANMNIFAASLGDMTIYAVAHAGAGQALDLPGHAAMAAACYEAGLRDNSNWSNEADTAVWRSAFSERLEKTMWENIAAGGSPFSESPKALIRWAPIADELKKYDRKIVENSIRFAWNEVTQDFRRRLDAASVVRDWQARQRQGTTHEN